MRRGGAIRVHRAVLDDERIVCVKVLGPHAGQHERRLIENERRILERLSGLHGIAHAIPLVDAPPHILATTWVFGPDLAVWASDPTVSIEQRRRCLDSLANTVGLVHARSVIHRDLSPWNVALSEAGDAVVLDWGHAWCSSSGEAAIPLRGTAGYSVGILANDPGYSNPDMDRWALARIGEFVLDIGKHPA